ncbi:integrase catalytic domain-containing protein [Trichonephila inaurata madagascariensis]|uniref:Integrase catalytic domain-containing protein n=1 Tax=Trichonephila inaurata madagascariensis TaxID=2747483 RepID=A0A8X6YN26_9ARAC|nr:integrase catalytic domain-containing protein [Trichonephila inaurata madagascariensis]
MPVKDIQGLGYSDASEAAYGAVVYMHCVKEDGSTTTKLIGSKSRVAPIKVISIPRLELSACLLLAQLVEKVRLSLQVHLAKIILHTDSTIAIAWINTPANQLKTFVGNRVSKIQTLTENYEWKHIPSAQNPADIISRGVNPEELSSLTLWWNGPQHLDIPEQFIEPSITSSDELYFILFCKKQFQQFYRWKSCRSCNPITSETSFTDPSVFICSDCYQEIAKAFSPREIDADFSGNIWPVLVFSGFTWKLVQHKEIAIRLSLGLDTLKDDAIEAKTLKQMSCCTFLASRQKIQEPGCGCELLPHPTYYPDYHIFRQLDKFEGKELLPNQGVLIQGVRIFFDQCDTNFCQRGIFTLKSRWTKCISADCGYLTE